MPGKLLLLVGDSGSGKDSLLSVLKNEVGSDLKLFFPKRWITRYQEDQNEKYHQIKLTEFVQKIKGGNFFIWWDAYDYLYGIDGEVKTLLESGYHVILNVSRKVVPEIKQLYPLTTVILVESSPEVIAKRLDNRIRGEKNETKVRLERAKALKNFNDWDFCFNNDAELQNGAKKFVALIKKILAGSTT